MSTEENQPQKTGRKRLPIDPAQVEALAMIGCTQTEIAAVMKCSVDTLARRFADILKRGKEAGKTSLRRWMWKAAEGGNITMMVWLSKQMLGYTDKPVDAEPAASNGPDYRKATPGELDTLRRLFERSTCPNCRPGAPCPLHPPITVTTLPPKQLPDA